MRSLPRQLFILVIGTPMYPKETVLFFVYIKYKVNSLLHAVDVAFKLCHLFNLEYPSQSGVIYLNTFFFFEY